MTQMKRYLEKYGRGSRERVARAAGVSGNTVDKASRGEPLTWKMCQVLSAATGGEVSPMSMLDPEQFGDVTAV